MATRRTLQLAGAFSGFVGSYLVDTVTGKLKENEVRSETSIMFNFNELPWFVFRS